MLLIFPVQTGYIVMLYYAHYLHNNWCEFDEFASTCGIKLGQMDGWLASAEKVEWQVINYFKTDFHCSVILHV